MSRLKTLNKTLIVFLPLMVAFVAQAYGAPPASVTIDKIKDKKPAVVFPHAAHLSRVEGKCGSCHVSADGSGALKPEFLAKPASMAEAMKHPFHQQCKGCHQSSGKGPTGCSDCHK